jgi:hypothetical protein
MRRHGKVKNMKQPESDARLLLPWHVNRTLDGSERTTLDAALESSPDLAAERVWLDSLRQSLKQQHPTRADDAGLDQLMARIAAEKDSGVLSFPSAPALTRSPWRTRGFAIAASIILAQGVLLGTLLVERHDAGNLAPLSGPQVATSGVVLQVVFSEQASEVAIRTALREVHGEIVGGPGALGVYLVRVEQTQALEQLRNKQGVVESAVLEAGK